MTITPEQKARRRLAVGASEVAALFGDCPWTDSYKVWARKSGADNEEITSHQEVTFMKGDAMEPMILGWWADRFLPEGSTLATDPAQLEFKHPKGVKLTANLDAWYEEHGRRHGVEAKYTSSDDWDAGPGVPRHVYLQVQAQILCADLSGSHVIACIDPRNGTSRWAHHYIQPNPLLMEEIEEVVSEFWTKHVEAGDPPKPTYRSAETVKKIARVPNHTVPVERKLHNRLAAARTRKLEAEKHFRGVQAEFLDALKDGSGHAECGSVIGADVEYTYFEYPRTTYGKDAGKYENICPTCGLGTRTSKSRKLIQRRKRDQ